MAILGRFFKATAYLVVVVVVVVVSLMWGRDERLTTTNSTLPFHDSKFDSNAKLLHDFATCAGGMLHAVATPDILRKNVGVKVAWKWYEL